MPIPKPEKDETKDEFISRCMIFHDEEGKFNLKNEDERKQALAISFSQWKRKDESNSIKTFDKILKEKV
jgi:hypothetical protein